MPVVDALKGFFAGQKNVGHRECDIHHTLTLSHTSSLEFLHFLWICWDYHLSETRKKKNREWETGNDCEAGKTGHRKTTGVETTRKRKNTRTRLRKVRRMRKRENVVYLFCLKHGAVRGEGGAVLLSQLTGIFDRHKAKPQILVQTHTYTPSIIWVCCSTYMHHNPTRNGKKRQNKL